MSYPSVLLSKTLDVYIVATNEYVPRSKKDPFAANCYPAYRLALFPLEDSKAFQLGDAVKIGQVHFTASTYQVKPAILPALHLKANDPLWAAFLQLKSDWEDFYKYNQRINYLNQTKENTDRQSLF